RSTDASAAASVVLDAEPVVRFSFLAMLVASHHYMRRALLNPLQDLRHLFPWHAQARRRAHSPRRGRFQRGYAAHPRVDARRVGSRLLSALESGLRGTGAGFFSRFPSLGTESCSFINYPAC